MNRASDNLITRFKALADPARLRLVALCGVAECSVSELTEVTGLSQPRVSQHLKALREAGIVTARADAQRRIYRLTDHGLDEVEAWLGRVREFWNQRLDKLEEILGDAERGEEQ